MHVLITGGAGFIGSNFARYMVNKYTNYEIINVDVLTYCGNLNSIADLNDKDNYTFIRGDICNGELLEEITTKYSITHIVNFAAESHVDRSISDSTPFFKTNVMGTVCLLDLLKRHSHIKYVQISTDEVYGSLPDVGSFLETTTLAPSSPYSSSKASGDLIALSYFKTYGYHINVTRCSNNYGPFQYPEKLIPLMVTNLIEGKALPLYGNGHNVRDWLHVYDHCTAIDLVIHKGEAGTIYNIGGSGERTNLEIVRHILSAFDMGEECITYVKDRLGHDYRYSINASFIQHSLGWKPIYTVEKGLDETIQWYKDNESWWKPLKL